MPAKTIKGCLSDTLEDLGESGLKKFGKKLLDRREGPKVKRNQVENKDALDLADVLVSIFTEAGALPVTLEILRDIDYNDEARELEEATSALLSSAAVRVPAPGPSIVNSPGPSAGPLGGGAGKHFVDKYRDQLIKRVSMVAPILDALMAEGVIDQERNDNIMSKPTTQDRIRELYRILNADSVKDIFKGILDQQEPYLLAELQKNV